MENERSNTRSTKVVVAANAFLIIAKLSVAIMTGSIAALAVLIDSLFDMAGAIFAYFGVREAEKPADADHLYGHKKYEALTSVAQLVFIAITALLIMNEAIGRLNHPRALEITAADIGIMVLTVLVDIGIVAYLAKNAKMGSLAMQASVGNYTSDIMQNSLVVIGLFATKSGYFVADPLAALIVSLLMLRVVYRVGKSAFGELTDAGPSMERVEEYGKAIMKVKGVKSFHKLRARMIAGQAHVDMHIQLAPKMSLYHSHRIAENVKMELLEKFPEVKEVLVHAEPNMKKFLHGPKFGS